MGVVCSLFTSSFGRNDIESERISRNFERKENKRIRRSEIHDQIVFPIPSEFRFLLNSSREYGIQSRRTNTNIFRKITREEFKRLWIYCEHEILETIGEDNEIRKVLYVQYASSNGIFLYDWIKDLQRLNFRTIKFDVPSNTLDPSKIPKSLIYWVFESQQKSIGESITILSQELLHSEQEIQKDFEEEMKRVSASSEAFDPYKVFSEATGSNDFISKNVLLSHSLLGHFFIHLVTKYDRTPDFHHLYHSKFPFSLFSTITSESLHHHLDDNKNEIPTDFPHGIYCFNVDGDCYVIHYQDESFQDRVAVIDGGRNDIETLKTLYTFFFRFKIRNIDIWVLTHRDEDHVGSFVMFLKGHKEFFNRKDHLDPKNESVTFTSSYFPRIHHILYRRNLLEEKCPFDDSDESILDKYREKYRYLSVRDSIKEIEHQINIIDPDTMKSTKNLDELNIKLLPREHHRENFKVWQKIHGITGENFYSLSVLITHCHHENENKSIKRSFRCIFSGDVREDTIIDHLRITQQQQQQEEELKREKEEKGVQKSFYFADLPMHGNKSCCSLEKFLNLDVQHFVCARNKKNPQVMIRNRLLETKGHVFLPGFGRRIIRDEKDKEFGEIIKVTDVGNIFRINFC